MKISASGFMADILLDPILFLDISVMKEIHQFFGHNFISQRQQVNVDFVNIVSSTRRDSFQLLYGFMGRIVS